MRLVVHKARLPGARLGCISDSSGGYHPTLCLHIQHISTPALVGYRQRSSRRLVRHPVRVLTSPLCGSKLLRLIRWTSSCESSVDLHEADSAARSLRPVF